MLYRDHKGSLEDSLKTVQKIHSKAELISHLNTINNNRHVTDVKFYHAGYDQRINWNTFYVMQRMKGEENYTIAGMSNTNKY